MPDFVKIVGSMEIARTGADRQVIRGDCLEIMVENVWSCGNDDFERTFLAEEIRSQNFDCRVGRPHADRADYFGEMFRAAIREIIAID